MFAPLTSFDLHTCIQGSVLLIWAWMLGSAIGLQREIHGHAAGLRTHALVCGASCLLSIVSFSAFDGKGDGGRVAAQVVTGIGFLGAGVIMRRGVSVQGLTTAATVWLSAGLGIAVGAGLPFALLATLTTVLTLVTIVAAKPLERRLAQYRASERGASEATVTMRVPASFNDLPLALSALTSAKARLTQVETEPTTGVDGAKGDFITARVTVQSRHGGPDREALSAALRSAVPDIEFEWDNGVPDGDGPEH